MDTKLKAIMMMVIIVVGAGAAAFLILGIGPGPADDNLSPSNGDIWISEIHMNSTLTVDEEYFELYVSDGYDSSSIVQWSVTTYDEEGVIALPTIINVDAEDYIAVYSGSGINDLDASDGSATIFLGLESRILDPEGDEIALMDTNGQVVHFIRYGGGNGDPVQDGWPEDDDGPSLPVGHLGSLSFFGQNKTNTSAWLESLPTPGAPNVYAYTTTTTATPYTVTIQSGVSTPFSFLGIDDTKETGKNETVDIYPAAGVNASVVQQIKEHIEFSLKFYEEKGFDRGPQTPKPGHVNVTVMQGTTTEVIGSCSSSGQIVIKLGTIPSKIDLKYVCEHELMHAFQFKTENVDGWRDHAPMGNLWWLEGQATYWGIESTKANYNLTNQEIQDEFKRVGDHNWMQHYTDLNRSIFLGWGGSYSDYIGSYLFMKFIRERFGEEKLKEIFDKAVDHFSNDSKDVSPEDAAAEVLGLPWDQLVAMFHAWMMTGAISDNGVPERKGHVNVTYNGAETGDSITVGPYGAGVERIKVNDSTPFSISFQTPPGSTWRITIIYVYEDGSREQAFNTPFTIGLTSAPWPVNPNGHDKKLVEIIVIKTLVKTDKPAQINMTLTPAENFEYRIIEPQDPAEPFFLPPFEIPPDGPFDPIDWPWRRTWGFNYTNDIQEIEVEVNATGWAADSFFDIFFEIGGEVIYSESLNADPAISHRIMWDPENNWPFGLYNITIATHDDGDGISGTLDLIGFLKPGWSHEYPYEHGPGDVVTCVAAEYRTHSEMWFSVFGADEHLVSYLLHIMPEYETLCNWYMEVYNTTHLDLPLRSTQEEYEVGEWPRVIYIPAIYDPDASSDLQYLLRLVFEGEGACEGTLEHLLQPLAGSSIDNPLWGTFGEPLVLNLPTPYPGSGNMYVNITVLSGLVFNFSIFTAVEDLNVLLWNGDSWASIAFNGVDRYWGDFLVFTDVVCIYIESSGTPGYIDYILVEES